jgi:DNA-binding MarR family transcriptional regulator
MIPRWIFRAVTAGDLKSSDLMMLEFLDDAIVRESSPRRRTSMTNADIGAGLGITSRSVSSSLHRLEQAGAIRQEWAGFKNRRHVELTYDPRGQEPPIRLLVPEPDPPARVPVPVANASSDDDESL